MLSHLKIAESFQTIRFCTASAVSASACAELLQSIYMDLVYDKKQHKSSTIFPLQSSDLCCFCLFYLVFDLVYLGIFRSVNDDIITVK